MPRSDWSGWQLAGLWDKLLGLWGRIPAGWRDFIASDLASWLAFLAALIVMWVTLRRSAGYIDFYDDWKLKLEKDQGTIRVTGTALVSGPIAEVETRANIRINGTHVPMRAAELKTELDRRGATMVDMVFVAVHPEFGYIPKRAFLRVEVRLSDGTSRTLKKTIPLQ